MSKIVSIIIPTYNRAHLIGETLDSVLAQTYSQWECIVVDDGSTDTTKELLQTYVNRDERIHYVQRPDTHHKGGNGARNYGFEMSSGEYVQWFDSDDIMTPETLELKVKAFQDHDVDFVISKSQYLGSNDPFYHYNYNADDINFESFAIGNVSWVTDDFMIKRTIAKQINFNEVLRAGQEYNYSCKFLLLTNKAYVINKFLTLRRASGNSIGNDRRQDRSLYLESRFKTYWLNYLEISQLTHHEKFEKHSLLICMSCHLRSDEKILLPNHFYKAIFKVFKFKAIYFILAKWSKLAIGKYYYFYEKLKS